MGKKVSKDQWISRAYSIHGDRYDYSFVEIISMSHKVKIICAKHGIFEQLAKNHLYGQNCKKCEDERKTFTTEKFISKSKIKHGDLFDYSKTIYTGALNKVIIICMKHGEFLLKASHHLEGQGCARCVYDKKMYSTDKYISLAQVAHDNKYDYSKVEYKTSYDPVIIGCPLHGLFKQKAYVHLAGSGCPNCMYFVSNPETEWLNSLFLPNDSKHRQVSLLGKRVDGFDPLNNIIYEFYGDFWHGNPNQFNPNAINPILKKTYGELYSNTLKREEKLRDAGYTVISIWESDFKKLLASS